MKLNGELARLRVFWRPLAIKKYLRSVEKPKLHLGCGANDVAGWLNADKFAVNADIYLNVYHQFPFDQNTFYFTYSEHMIEHIRLDKVKYFLSEVYRTLKVGGVFRVTCPDLELYAQSYVNNDEKFFNKIFEGIENKRRKYSDMAWVARTKGGAFMSSAVREYHRHRWMYDFETLNSCLREIGFKEVIKQSFNKSLNEELARMDRPHRAIETLYIDAVK